MQLLLGLGLLFVVVMIWVASAEVTEYIFSDENFTKPYFLTYFSASCFSLYLCGFLFKPKWRQDARLLAHELFLRRTRPQININEQQEEQEESEFANHSSAPSSPLLDINNPNNINHSDAVVDPNANMLTMRENIVLALKFVLLWFSANYVYNLSLSNTSVSSNTILSATSSFFTLVFGSCFPGTKDDAFTFAKLFCVLLSIGGVVMVSLSDSERSGDKALGDVEAVISAMLYGVYLVFLRFQTGTRNIDMLQFLAFFGLFTLLLIWPGLFVVHYTGFETFEFPGTRTWLFLLLIAIVGTILSELLWLHATLITTPVISSVAVSVSIPVAIVADHIFGMRESALTWMYFVGTALLFISFIVLALLAHDPQIFAKLQVRIVTKYKAMRGKGYSSL